MSKSKRKRTKSSGSKNRRRRKRSKRKRSESKHKERRKRKVSKHSSSSSSRSTEHHRRSKCKIRSIDRHQENSTTEGAGECKQRANTRGSLVGTLGQQKVVEIQLARAKHNPRKSKEAAKLNSDFQIHTFPHSEKENDGDNDEDELTYTLIRREGDEAYYRFAGTDGVMPWNVWVELQKAVEDI